MNAWEEQVRTRVRPHLFTAREWAALSPNQRQVLRAQRRAVVAALAVDHERRYHSQARALAMAAGHDRLNILAMALEAGPDPDQEQ